nr:hypothetical protein [Tanacetum cinerariifolium]
MILKCVFELFSELCKTWFCFWDNSCVYDCYVNIMWPLGAYDLGVATPRALVYAGDDYEGPSIFDDDQFEDELEMGDDAFVLIGKEVAPNSEIPEAMFPLLDEFSDVFPDELPDTLMSPGEHEELRSQVEELVSKGHVRERMSPCAQPHGPLDLMSLNVSVPKKVQDFFEGLPYHGDSSDDDIVGNSRMNFVYP